ncbi:MAG: protein kinase [Planctomycetes bacterium]|nr:protein kinase [Planctomycetota bacterium]
MGIVYKARHLQLQRLVALKMILPGNVFSSRMLERFLTEAWVVARFQHPNLVQIYDVGEIEGQPYFSLELLEGGSLNQKLEGNPLPIPEAVALLETLARAVEYAHQKGIVHRDLKPSNILLTETGTPKIADFGLAKHLNQDTGKTEEGGVMGTPSYMAPEQAWGKSGEVGPQADIYALGVILYEMLTGRPPFKSADKWQTVQMVKTEEPLPPRRLVPQISHDLELICLKCLRKEPTQRYASAFDLAEELRRLREGRPILTRPAPVWEKTWKWVRRQPAVASLIGVSVIALLSAFLFLDQRARSAERELREQQRTSAMRGKVQQLHLQAQEAADRGLLQDGQGSLQAAFEIIKSEPSLSDLKPALTTLQSDLSRRNAEFNASTEADAVYKRFFQHRDTALFHGMVFTGVELPANVAATKKSCEEALALYSVALESAAGPVFSQYLSVEQKKKCTAACYELLLVWAEAEAQPEPGNRAPDPIQITKALRLLDRAAKMEVSPTGAYHLRRSKYLAIQGNPDAARDELKLAAAIPPVEALDHFLTGDSHQKQGLLAEAARDYANALRAQPDHFWAQYFLAICNLQLARPAQARDNLTTCMMSRPEFHWLYLLRGFANGQLNEFRSAEDDYAKALSLQPEPQAHYGILVNQGVLRVRQVKLADGLLPMPELPMMPSLEFAQRSAIEAYRSKKLVEASGFLQDAIRLQPEQNPAYRYLALVAQQQKKLDEAITLIVKAIETAKNQPLEVQAQLFGQRARIHREKQDTDAARIDLVEALRLAPNADDYLELGRILHLTKNDSEALNAYAAAIHLRKDDAEAHRLKAVSLMTLHRESEAVLALDQYLAKRGKPTADIYKSRGQARARLNQFPAAIADYTQAIALQPDAATHAARGWLFLSNDVLPLALQDFEEAVRLDPKNAQAFSGRGLIRARMGQQAMAVADAEAAMLHGQPETFRTLWTTAHIFAQLAAESGSPGSRTGTIRTRYQEKAVDLLRRAMERVPATERHAYWKQVIAPDALLNPIRELTSFENLERAYAKPKGR